ncbi:MAG: hypothetical protein AAGA12_09775 [Pseudomonadota bacterium]
MFNQPPNKYRQAWRSAAAWYETKLPNIRSLVSFPDDKIGFGLWPIVLVSGEYRVQLNGALPPDLLASSFNTLEDAENYLVELYSRGFTPADLFDVPGEAA